MYIPNNLKAVRKACNLTQVEVAKRLGFTGSERISKWEHGNMYPHIVNLLKLAIIYGKTAEELYPELLFNLRLEMTPKPVYSSVPSPSTDAQVPEGVYPHRSDML